MNRERLARGAAAVPPAAVALALLPPAAVAAAIALGAPPLLLAAALGALAALFALRRVLARPVAILGWEGAWLGFGILALLAGEVSAISFGGQSGRILWADAVLGLGVLAVLARNRFALALPRPAFLAALLPVLAWCAIGLPLARDPLTGIAELKEWIVAAVAGLWAARWMTTRVRARLMLRLVAVVGAVLAVMMAQVALHDPRGFAIAVLTKNVDLPWGRSNYLAGMLALAFPIALALLGAARNGGERLAWLAATLLVAFGLALSASKGAVLAVVLATTAAFLGPLGKGSRALPRLVLLAVFAGVAVLFASGPLKVALDYRMQASALDYSGSERLALYRLAFEQGLRHPLFGIGINNFSVASHGLHGLDTVPHNLELGFFSELGVPGLLFVLAWCATLLRSARRAVLAGGDARGRTLALGAAAAVIGALIHNQVESTLYGEQFKLLLMMVAAALWRLEQPLPLPVPAQR